MSCAVASGARALRLLRSAFILLVTCSIPFAAAADRAPAFECATLSGKGYRLETLSEGRPFLVLTFFGTSCIPCQKKIAQLNELLKDQGVREKAAFYAVNADGHDPARLEKEIEKRGIQIDFPVISDENQAITNLYVDGIVPLTVLIDNNLQILSSYVGARPGTIKQLADRIMGQAKETAK